MQRHKIIARIILLVLSAINIAVAAPVLLRQIHEVSIEVVDIAEDVTAALQKRRNPTDAWSTTAADPGGANAPPSPDSNGVQGPERMPLGPQGLVPTDLNPSRSTQGSTEWSNHPNPPPLDSPPPVDDDLALTLGGNYHLYHPDTPPPGPAHNDLPLNIDSNDPLLPGPGPTDQDNSHPLPMGPRPLPTHNDFSLDINLNFPHQPIQEPSWNSDQDTSRTLSLGLPMDSSSSGSDPTYSELWWNLVMKLHSWLNWEYQSTFPSPEAKPPPPFGHDNLGEVLNPPLSNLGPGQIDDQPPSEAPSLHPGSLKRPLEDPLSDQRSPKRPELDAPLDVVPLRWAYPPAALPTLEHPSDPGPSTWAYLPSNPELSAWLYPLQDPGSSTLAHAPPDPGPSTWAHALPFLGSSTRLYPPSGPQHSTSVPPPPDPTWFYPLQDPGLPTLARPPSPPSPGSSTLAHNSGPSTPEAPSRQPAGPQPEHNSVINFEDLFRDRFKRSLLSGSCSASAGGVDSVEG